MGIVGGVDRESYRKISRVRDALHVPRDKFQAEQARVWPRLLGFVKHHDKCTANILQKIDILSMKPQLTLALFAAKDVLFKISSFHYEFIYLSIFLSNLAGI